MDEDSLQAALRAHDAQLQQVERALRADLDPAELADLRRLRGDLQELIALTEASLVSVRKSKLLATLDAPADAENLAFPEADAEAETRVAPDPASQDPAPQSGAAPGTPGPAWRAAEEEQEVEQEEEEQDLSGRKVSAPYYSAWGTLEYHNAMVVGAAEAEDGAASVRVLYLYPTHASLKPCPFFLEGKCRFKENCRFSHGQVVSVDELRPFRDPDLSSLQAGSACLAKQQDGLWHPARITDVDGGHYTVRFDSLLLKEAVVEGDSILPPLRTEPAGPSDSDSSDAEDPSYARVVEPGAASGTCGSAFAGWEVHTRGIGSRLLAKMGYEPGKGLGRHADGRVEPVLAVVLPRGKSLDQCAAILQRKPGQSPGPRRAPRGGGHRGGSRARPPPRSVFDFLNEKLQGQVPAAPEAGAVPAARRSGKEVYHADEGARRAMSLRLFRTQQKMEQTQRDIRGIQEALARNTGRHSVTAARLQERLAGAQRLLGQLRAQEAGLQREQRTADTHKKMTEF